MSTHSILDINYQQLKNIGLNHENIIKTYQFISCFWDYELDSKYKLTAIKDFQEFCLLPENSFIKTPLVYTIGSTIEAQEAATNGCGPQGVFSLPDGPWNKCCDLHDLCYNKGGGHIDRLNCDYDFYKCLHKAGLPIIAEIFTLAVLIGGWFFFNWKDDEVETNSTPINPCQGKTCLGTEVKYENPREIKYFDQGYNPIPQDPSNVTPYIRTKLSNINNISWNKKCKYPCKCQVDTYGTWNVESKQKSFYKNGLIVELVVDKKTRTLSGSCA